MSEEREQGEKKNLSSMSGEDLQNAVQSILADPAFGKLVEEFSGGAPSEKESSEPPAAPPKSGMQITPEMMERLPQMMSAIAPLVSGMHGGEKGNEKSGDEKSKNIADAEKRKKLLAALRPYLSSSRRDAIDSIMKVSEMTDLIGRFGGIGSSDSQKPKK